MSDFENRDRNEKKEKPMKRVNLKNARGFSLIELMIVVAIIGILSAIAIPNYQRFQRKARQSEARTLLSAYYTAAKATQAEYGYFTGNFTSIGFQPEGDIGYHVSALDWTDPPQATLPNDNACVTTLAGACTSPATFETWRETANALSANYPSAITVVPDTTNNTFLVGAISNLGNTTTSDEWSINNTKQMNSVQDGL